MSYEVHIIRSAEKEIERLPSTIYARLIKRTLALGDNPRPKGAKKLTGSEEYRMRAGDYRILYLVDDKRRIVTVMAVGHRREVYR